jgi:septum formation protein
LRFLTAVYVVDAASGRSEEHLDDTRVRFRRLTAGEISAYLDREPALDCAGAFKAEGLGISLFESIESRDPTALTGLPLIAVAGALRRLGRDPLASG